MLINPHISKHDFYSVQVYYINCLNIGLKTKCIVLLIIFLIPGTLILGQEEAVKNDKDVEAPSWFDEYKEEIEDKISETIKGKCKQLYINYM